MDNHNGTVSQSFDEAERGRNVTIWSQTLPSGLTRIHAGPWDNKQSVIEHAVLANELASRFDVIEDDLPQTVELYSQLDNDRLLGFLSETESAKKQHTLGCAGSLISLFSGAACTVSTAVAAGALSAGTLGAAVTTAAAVTAGCYVAIKSANRLEAIRDKVHAEIAQP